ARALVLRAPDAGAGRRLSLQARAARGEPARAADQPEERRDGGLLAGGPRAGREVERQRGLPRGFGAEERIPAQGARGRAVVRDGVEARPRAHRRRSGGAGGVRADHGAARAGRARDARQAAREGDLRPDHGPLPRARQGSREMKWDKVDARWEKRRNAKAGDVLEGGVTFVVEKWDV